MAEKLINPHYRVLKSDDMWELLTQDHEAFVLFNIICWRAKRKNCFSVHGLEMGEAMIGDWEICGFSSEKVYRNAKKRLEKYGIISLKGATDGTRAKVLHKGLIDINEEKGANEGRTTGGQGATNKKGKKGKNNIINNIIRENLPESWSRKLTELEVICEDAGISFECTQKQLEKLLSEYAFSRVKFTTMTAADWAKGKGFSEITAMRIMNWLERDFNAAKESEKAKIKPQYATESLRKAAEKDLGSVHRTTAGNDVSLQMVPELDAALSSLIGK